jgi:putative ABC transport system permease protein
METLRQDMRYGLRMLMSKPGFTIVAALTLALGIGANTTIFSMVNAVLLRPLPYQSPDRLVLVQEDLPKLGWSQLSASPAEFLDYKEGNQVFSEIAAFKDLSLNLTGQGVEAQRVQVARVSANLFPLLGIEPLGGRGFSPEEDQVGSSNVAILSYKLWKARFGGDLASIGQVVRLDDQPYTVVGVMPPQFQFPYTWTSFADAAELWIPLALTEQEKNNRAASFDYGVIGRLKPGVTLPQAQANIEAVATMMQRQHPDVYSGDVQVRASVVSLEQEVVKRVKPLLLILLGAVGMVLLIACANVADLLLARAATRQKEMAIRSAMGAGTLRLMRQLLTESILLSLLGGGAGLLLATWAMNLIVKFGPENVPRLQEATLDPLVLVFTLSVSLLTGILFGLAPALQNLRLNLNEVLKESGGRASTGRRGKHLRSLLVIFEIASALVLLAGAGLLGNSFVRLLREPTGFDPEGVVIARTALSSSRYPKTDQSKAVQKQVLERLAALPEVQAVAETTNLPLIGDRTIGYVIEGQAEDAVNTAYNAWVSDGYFRAMGIRLLKGRPFNDEDRADTPPVIIVNETMASRFWPAGDALGKRIKWGGWADSWLTIVGIVADVKVSSLEAETRPAVYMPIFQIPRARSNVIYVVRTTGDAATLTSAVRREIRAVDEELPVYDLRTMNQVIAASVSQRRFSMSLLAVFAAAALLLAAIGLYGVMSYTVTQRTQEIGIRMALGAQANDVLRLIVGQGMTLACIGVAVGLAVGLAISRLISSLLYGVSATDAATFVVISLILTGVALIACFIPARRATKVDPIVALRYE